MEEVTQWLCLTICVIFSPQNFPILQLDICTLNSISPFSPPQDLDNQADYLLNDSRQKLNNQEHQNLFYKFSLISLLLNQQYLVSTK